MGPPPDRWHQGQASPRNQCQRLRGERGPAPRHVTGEPRKARRPVKSTGSAPSWGGVPHNPGCGWRLSGCKSRLGSRGGRGGKAAAGAQGGRFRQSPLRSRTVSWALTSSNSGTWIPASLSEAPSTACPSLHEGPAALCALRACDGTTRLRGGGGALPPRVEMREPGTVPAPP